MSKEYDQILNFLEEVDALKSVERKGYLKDHSRHDNPAEHTWHMMLTMVLLKLQGNDGFNLEHALCLALVHDIVEVYAGDVPKYDKDAREAHKKIEEESADKIFSLLPDKIGSTLHDWWKEFEENQTPEANFANHCDYLQGFSQSYFAHGKSWKELGVTREKTLEYTVPIKQDNENLGEFIDALYEHIDKKNFL